MLAGQMRRRVTIQSRATTVDAVGGQSQAWTDVCTLWAQVVPTGGKESTVGGARRAESLYTVTTRYYPGIAPKMRILFEGQIFEIVNINDTDQRHRELVMSCQAGLTNG